MTTWILLVGFSLLFVFFTGLLLGVFLGVYLVQHHARQDRLYNVALAHRCPTCGLPFELE